MLPHQNLKGGQQQAEFPGDSALGVSEAQLLAVEAAALLSAAAERIPVPLERLQAFARACLEASEAGRLALAVLEGGMLAPRRAVELARRAFQANAKESEGEKRGAQ